MKNLLKATICIIILTFAGWASFHAISWYTEHQAQKAYKQAQQQAINTVLQDRKNTATSTDLFAGRDTVHTLVIGIDKRAGQEHGHCDAIQLLSLDQKKQTLTITAVPRGTYSPLPPGKGTTSSDYYVSNACGLGGLEYGINQIERILGQEADHIVVVGFSEILGLLRLANLPTTETLQWLRHRQGYTIGEPQRARNHSTFIKQMILRFLPDDRSTTDTAALYLGYKTIHTDLSFTQIKQLVDALIDTNIKTQPDNILLKMKPAYDVQDIVYDEQAITEHLEQTVGKVSRWLSKDDYANKTAEQIQTELLALITKKQEDPDFLAWAYENHLWLQIEDQHTRNQTQYNLTVAHANQFDETKKQEIIADYIIEMQHRGLQFWEDKAKEELLKQLEIPKEPL